MDSITVIHGKFANNLFVPDDSPPPVQGRAELLVYEEQAGTPTDAESENKGTRVSIFDLLGKAAVLRSGEDIDAQLEAERQAWDED